MPTVDGDVDLTIPHGTQPEDKKILRKRGVPQINRIDSRGDQYVTLKVVVPKHLSAKQKDLLMEAFGTKKDIKSEKKEGKKGFIDYITEKLCTDDDAKKSSSN